MSTHGNVGARFWWQDALPHTLHIFEIDGLHCTQSPCASKASVQCTVYTSGQPLKRKLGLTMS